MAVAQPYDAAQHHVGLGTDTANLWGLMIGGSYARRGQQNPLGKPSDVGADALIGSDRLSVWTQRDYSGGEFQRDFDDDAMFYECGYFAPNQLGFGLRSVPPVVPIDLSGNGNVVPRTFDLVRGKVYVTNVSEDGGYYRVVQYEGVTGRGSAVGKWTAAAQPPTAHPNQRGNCAAWNFATGRLWVGYTGQAGIRVFDVNDVKQTIGGRLVKTGIALAETQHLDPPATNVTAIQDIQLFGPLRLVAGTVPTLEGVRLWNYIGGADSTTKWSAIGTLPGDVIASTVYNNAVYYLTRNGDGQTQLSMTQGDQVFPVLTFPYYFRGMAMAEYAGRLYISGVGYDLDGNNFAGELHEVNGTSLRLVRTFRSEAGRLRDQTSVMRSMRCLGVAEGMLWMPDDSCVGLEGYDATTDGFFGGPRLIRTPDRYPNRQAQDTQLIDNAVLPGVPVSAVTFTGILATGSSLLVWGTSAWTSASGLYRVAEDADDTGAYNPYITTSDFSPEPGRLKSWSEVVSVSRYGAPQLEVSTNGGETWLSAPGAYSQQGGRWETTFDLSDVPASRALRLKFVFDRTGDPSEGMVEMLAHSLSFAIHGSGKSGFTFHVLLAEDVQAADPDHVVDQRDVISEIASFLWQSYQACDTLVYRDVDGTDRKVYIANLEENRPQLTQSGERLLSVTLLEL